MAMADLQYRRRSSPGRANRSISDASISLSPFDGSGPGSALGQTSDLLGLPGSTSMSFDLSSVPRSLSTSDYASREPNNTYNPAIFLDGHSNQQQAASNTSALQWSHNYAIQPSGHNITAASAIPINRFQSEPQQSWTHLRIAAPPRSTNTSAPVHQKLRQRPGSNSRFPAGPGSDLVSRSNETDEGYYTHSQPDVQSVHSMRQWDMEQDRQNVQHGHVPVPLTYPPAGPRNRGTEQPDSGLHRDQTNANPTVQPHNREGCLACSEEGCKVVSRTQSDFRKHMAWHKKEHVCTHPGCGRTTKGFANINDLERHQKSVHHIPPKHGKSKDYKCFGESCSKHEKVWPRFDNFKQHLRKMHPNENLDILLRKSDEWYEQHKRPTVKPAAHTAHPSSSSTSRQGKAQTMSQTRSHAANQGQWNYPGTAEDGRAINMRPPSRTINSNYARSEAGHYSTSVSGGNHIQNMGRPSPGNVQLQANRFQITCHHPHCSQTFTTFKLLQEHMQVQHGSQDVLNPHFRGTQTWQRSHTIQGNQPSLISGQFGSGQSFPGNAAGVQSLDQVQMRATNMASSPQTAPGAIPALPYRLEEDFEPMPVTDSQDPLLTSGGSDAFLAQVGMTDAFLAAASHISNLDPHPSQGQDMNQPNEDPQKRQAPQFSTEDVTSFLKDFASNLSNDRVVSAIEITVKSLQSTSSSGDVNNSPTPAPALVPGEVKFPRAVVNGKHWYLCTWEGCGKSMKLKCELRKHYQRHTLPWACTFDRCRNSARRFGSKNDWKRHENKQHEQQEKWRCGEQDANTSGKSMPATGDDACMRLFCTKDLYLNHLKDQHRITDGDVTNKLCKLQRIAAKCQGQYWCGFCNKIITMKGKGLEGDAERFNHIDHHFTKECRPIKDWIPLDGRPSPGESALPSEVPSPEQSSEAGSEEAETDEDNAAGARATQTTRPPQRTKKRPASVMTSGDRGRASKVARPARSRAHTTRTQMVYCCNCRNTFEFWQGTCTFCNHHHCDNCTAEVVESHEQD